MDQRTVGILGGGQLGRMLVEAANRHEIKVIVLDAENSPAKQINARLHVNGSFADPEKVRELAKQCDILTVEIEHVDTHVLEEIAESGVEVQPHWQTLRTIQDKYNQKKRLSSHGVSTVQSIPIKENTATDLEGAGDKLGYPFMLKSRTLAYDGRGNFPVRSKADIPAALAALASRPLYGERWANFHMELAVMVVKIADESSDDEATCIKNTLAYPVVETIHEDSICKLVYAPARNLSVSLQDQAQTLARRTASAFMGKGIFGVEMFLLADGNLLVNEVAPRPHNSGHYTIEACSVSQYDAHLRSILGLPFPLASKNPLSHASSGTTLATLDTNAIMLNILGGARTDSHRRVSREAMSIPGAHLHLYGKGNARPGRKMGHVTVIAGSMKEAEASIRPLIDLVDQARVEGVQPTGQGRVGQGPPPQSHVSKESPAEISHAPAVVAITMGSDSDLPVMKPGLALLRDLGIPFEVTITSAHRTPGRMAAFAQNAATKGIKVIIAGAGGAAHLPGMIAAYTPLPVIGVPVKGSRLDGLDSLLSIVQMPRGIPVATVAINNSENAALLAARVLGASDPRIRQKVERYAQEMEEGVLKKVDRLESVGWDGYGP